MRSLAGRRHLGGETLPRDRSRRGPATRFAPGQPWETLSEGRLGSGERGQEDRHMDDEVIEVNCQECGRTFEVALPLPDGPMLCNECESYAEAGGGL